MKLHFDSNLDYQLAAIEAVATSSGVRRSTASNSP